ncbi:MAG: sugar transferase [Candidatus Pacebacteria bacterium]|nr:sugar transferase [Candidatus Paceibacterota bacterium]MDD5621033.1 sugar transferase [Candidatus Paceibacterota bacterium]
MIFPSFLRRLILLFGDIILYYLALIITLIIRFGNGFTRDLILKHLIPFSCLLPVWIGLLALLDGYDLKTLKEKQILGIKIVLLGISGALISGLFFYIFIFFGITPKTNLVVFSLLFCFLLFLERQSIVNIFSGYLRRRIVFIGDSKETQLLIKTIQENPLLGWAYVKSLDENSLHEVQNVQTDVIVIVQENILNSQKEEFFHKLFPLKASFLDLPSAYEIILKKIPINSVDPKWFLAHFKEGKKQVYDKGKRIADLLISSLIFAVTLPLWPLIAIAIKLDDKGSVLFKQKRMGKNFKSFVNYKFRTMKENHDKTPWTLGSRDRRITRIGRFLRAIHLDELPQMINIIKGDISLIGPRPESIDTISFLEKEIPFYHLRHLIKPGFTGWAQVALSDAKEIEHLDNKERKTQYDFQKIEHDLYYIKNRSFLFDLIIFAKTIDVVLKRQRN